MNPYWTINPLKVEILSLRPKVILQYHQVIPPKLISNLLEEKTVEIFKSALDSQDTKELFSSTEQTPRNKVHTKILEILQLITGLNTKPSDASEEIQLFAPGGGSGQTFRLRSDAVNFLKIPQKLYQFWINNLYYFLFSFNPTWNM